MIRQPGLPDGDGRLLARWHLRPGGGKEDLLHRLTRLLAANRAGRRMET